ncbi:hypothetical protein SARC_02974 [Sphaeroforma arctica JP610]|uniref:BD-FAE-like domain-containing protein n=1 Tax=Sphaeroforma arctica JP610 TaxID=667725 RepID=A0A0L0G996_9EUKA|nr:hypothetical protein SARC_02974 [Sphaeroforma arctica JP610]KNC84833.1 hypothetical protein SARC_02974 [Sphaeroforma arctica JP610]|eukprot:XP_014158735.1 hypothetical protein SARC_02974 [Sphaeroforma arctica JP610]
MLYSNVVYNAAHSGYKHRMDIYCAVPRSHNATKQTESSSKLKPCIFYLHGGGWKRGDKFMPYGVNSGRNIGETLSAKGYPTFVVSYRLSRHHTLWSIALGLGISAVTATGLSVGMLSAGYVVQKLCACTHIGSALLERYTAHTPQPTSLAVGMFITLFTLLCMLLRYEELTYNRDRFVRHPGHIEDAARAYRFVHTNAHLYGGDGNCIFVMGHSAGGHLATLLALNPQYLNGKAHECVDAECGKDCLGSSAEVDGAVSEGFVGSTDKSVGEQGQGGRSVGTGKRESKGEHAEVDQAVRCMKGSRGSVNSIVPHTETRNVRRKPVCSTGLTDVSSESGMKNNTLKRKASRRESGTKGLISDRPCDTTQLSDIERVYVEGEYNTPLMRSLAGVISVSGVYDLCRLRDSYLTKYNYFMPAFGHLSDHELALADPIRLAEDHARMVASVETRLQAHSHAPTDRLTHGDMASHAGISTDIDTPTQSSQGALHGARERTANAYDTPQELRSNGVLRKFPFLLFNATFIEFHLREDSAKLCALLAEAGARVSHHILPSTTHGTIVGNVGRRQSVDDLLVTMVTDWLADSTRAVRGTPA